MVFKESLVPIIDSDSEDYILTLYAISQEHINKSDILTFGKAGISLETLSEAAKARMVKDIIEGCKKWLDDRGFKNE